MRTLAAPAAATLDVLSAYRGYCESLPGLEHAWRRRVGDASAFLAVHPDLHVWMDRPLVTRLADHGILKGITRTVVLDMIAAQGLKLEERAFTLDEAHAAREAFITSASQIVLPVVKIDGRPVGNGAPGLVASALRREFHRYAEIS